ncbi:dipeptide transport system permease protein DppB [Thermoclostridium stercorarium subsp. stercorarium DSM 8532]|jgi:oligopeptide transport system permease protein|uniref:Dipeptide transport system permease protein DppB n=3 Tax=Thermoclostridium stercorarium TaxID=1510 RepID=L7VS52_THES1|nr:ABC transporter permease [Thermoclostridium stercorarium]AGC69479.1 dipeptide transport system permease protein DppB [Thermoclostridium stercorarium subsp. stercorarium DSM 8532]AGI40434.1 ABC transporter permease subunit [Thermoclostridium stercorarium subsp. stercorarium DSM 8532]ANW99721.1 peptide ABC transporter permease [Thermoclostridium stercorarium subsp. thermolacticum DSM 2910]ANX02347.1 peptide ABC transporter permease [Thermoclostridium stercorarium subsp. leptospartum DSM 9219]
MSAYIIKRIVSAVVTLFLVATLTFFLMYLVPGGPFLSEKAPSPQTLKALEEKYGLDQPIGVQYVNYMKRLLHGDLGTSLKMRGQEVNDIIKTRFPVSARLGLMAVALAILVGIPMGAVAALNRGKWFDRLIMFVSTLGIAVPGFVVATVLMYLFGVELHVLPTFGLTSPLHYILPVVSLAFYPTAYISRLMRSSMLDVLGQDYMRTARAKGLSRFKSLFKHALRNAVLPVVTYLGPMLAGILTGSFVVEKIFTIPGLGSQFVGSITDRDYPLIMGTTIFFAFLLITLNVIVDIAYKIIDPRIKLK